MANEVFMPKLSSTMETGTLLQWFKEEGDSVETGEPLFEIMTDKINIEVEAYDDGVLLKKYYDIDDEIPVNQIIAYVGQQDEVVPDTSPGISGNEISEEKDHNESAVEETSVKIEEQSKVEPSEDVRATPAARRVARSNNILLNEISGSGPKGRVHVKDVNQVLIQRNDSRATPLAKKVSKAHQVSLESINGSGVNGKVMKNDVAKSIDRVSREDPSTQTSQKRKLSGMRKVIADRMQESVNTAPHVTLTSEIDMKKVQELRKNLMKVVESHTGNRLSYTDIIIKATGEALSRHPAMNASLNDDEIVLNNRINVGLAVALDEGLIVPVIQDVPSKGLREINDHAKRLAKNARNQKLQEDQLKGATFTVSNLGMYAVDAFTPIINLPQTAILGTGRIQEKPVVVDQEIEVRPTMAVSLSFDHRAIDGAPAAAFLTELKQILENPYELLA